MQYQRVYVKGGTYFFTVVSYKRKKILTQSCNVLLLREAFRYVMKKHPFKIDAFVLLPEHFHCIWTLPKDDHDFSKRWRLIKSYFSRYCNEIYKQTPLESRIKKKEQAVWQRRFWEHLLRDNDDYKRHVEYIHYNPVKHNLVTAPIDWEYSSFHRYVQERIYDKDWGANINLTFDEKVGKE
jgi:putative transposase